MVSDNWISVEDKLPKNRSYVLAHDGEGYSGVIIAFHHVGNWHKNSHSQENLKITHWMPLPEPPTK